MTTNSPQLDISLDQARQEFMAVHDLLFQTIREISRLQSLDERISLSPMKRKRMERLEAGVESLYAQRLEKLAIVLKMEGDWPEDRDEEQ